MLLCSHSPPAPSHPHGSLQETITSYHHLRDFGTLLPAYYSPSDRCFTFATAHLSIICYFAPLASVFSGLFADRRARPENIHPTEMDPWHPTPADVLEELVNTLPYVPWPFLLPIWVRQLSVSVSCFKLLCSLKFPTERTKVAFLISLLTGRALVWDRAIWNAQSTIINSFEAFTVPDQLLRLRQGTSTSDYTLQFRTLAATSSWNEAALLSAYSQWLDPRSRAQMAIYDDTMGLENFMQRASRISQRLSHCQPEENRHLPASTRCLSSSTRTHASWLSPSLMHGACLSPHCWTLPLLRSGRSFHQGLSRSTHQG